MKLAARIVAALALVAFATPALPCPSQKSQHTTAANQAGQQDPAAKQAPAKAEKAGARADREKLAKSQKEKGAPAARSAN